MPKPDGSPTYAEACHAEVLRAAPPRESHMFSITTDGSGWDKHKNSIGSAWIIEPSPHHFSEAELKGFEERVTLRGCSGSTTGTVQRAEHLALIHALHVLGQKFDLLHMAGLRSFLGGPLPKLEDFPRQRRIPIWWITDRENLALQVARKADGQTYYDRGTDLDLWCQFFYYEHIFSITPQFIPRNTTQSQTEVDTQAGLVRCAFEELRTGKAPSESEIKKLGGQ